MTVEEKAIIPETVHRKSPGRVEAMRRVNERGLGGMGGRRPKHGRTALAELIKRGLEAGGDALSSLHGDLVAGYLTDLGGAENVSAMDRGLVKRLVAVDLDLARGSQIVRERAPREQRPGETRGCCLHNVGS